MYFQSEYNFNYDDSWNYTGMGYRAGGPRVLASLKWRKSADINSIHIIYRHKTKLPSTFQYGKGFVTWIVVGRELIGWFPRHFCRRQCLTCISIDVITRMGTRVFSHSCKTLVPYPQRSFIHFNACFSYSDIATYVCLLASGLATKHRES